MSSFRIVVAQSPSEMDALEPLWNGLLRHQEHTMFQRFSWNRLAAEVFRDRLTPHVVAVENGTGAAILPAAFHHRENRIELLGEMLFDYRDVLHRGNDEVLQAAWRELAGHKKPLHIVAVQERSFKQRWYDFSAMPFASAPQVDRGMVTEAAFRQSHSRLARQMRRLQRQGISLRTFCGSDSEIVQHLYECKRTHFADDHNSNVFLDQRRCEFMVAVAAMAGPTCQIYTLSKDEVLVAGLVTFRDNLLRRFYTTYFNPQWAHYSPGQALLYEITAQSLGQGLSCDYMTGEYAYKLRLANSSRSLLRVDATWEQLSDMVAKRTPEAA